MSKESSFLIYCMELEKQARRLSGRQVYDLFARHGLFEFVTRFYELLHVHGEKYILEDLDARIAEAAA